MLATGGAGRIYASTTNAHINTGDGVGMALRAGFPVQDIEMWQFHPTGIAGAGVLVTEGCRGEGGYLINKNGERFMERYAPNAKDLAGRDVVARSMVLEIIEGRGCGPEGDHVFLKLDHLGEDVLNSRLPGICELSKTFAHVDPVKEPIPVVPTCHYMMGGIPTNVHGQALTQDASGNDQVIPGLFACGEVACVSVHGANRLGGNSLLDLIVFGRASGLFIEKALREGIDYRDAGESDVDGAMSRLNRLNSSTGGESVAALRKELQTVMQNYFGVFRTGEYMHDGVKALAELRARIENVRPDGQEQGVQHRAHRGARAAEPARSGRSDRDRRRGPQGEPRRARARGFPGARRRELAVPFAVPPGRQARGQAGVNFKPKTVETFEPRSAPTERGPATCCKSVSIVTTRKPIANPRCRTCRSIPGART